MLSEFLYWLLRKWGTPANLLFGLYSHANLFEHTPLARNMLSDGGLRSYISTLNFFNQYTEPIFITSVSSLRDLVDRRSQADDGKGGGVPSSRTSELNELDPSQRRRARTRWHLAYTLIRNPVLARDRGHRLASTLGATAHDDSNVDGTAIAEVAAAAVVAARARAESEVTRWEG